MTLVLKQYEQSIHETVANIKLAIRRRDAKAAVAQLNGLPVTELDAIWSALREWSVSETRLPDNDTLVVVKTLFDNYQLEPKKEFIERALSVLAYAVKS
jgi:hypothetical protein